MTKLIRRLGLSAEKGVALVAVLLVMVIFAMLVGVLLLQGHSDKVVAVNEQDHLKNFGYAEAGLTWAQRIIQDAGGGGLNELLDGPNNGSTADDNLLGLRDLSLTATSQFTNANEDTKSAIVTRDFGDGNRTYEAIRFPGEANTRAHVYVRIDDNFDDDPNDPSNNDPLTDIDVQISATAVAEYPVFVNGSGLEMPNNKVERGRAVRKLVVTLGGPQLLPAIATNGDMDVSGDMELCGDCGSVHTNQNMDISIGAPEICHNATASGTFADGGTIHGESGDSFPLVPIPTINPYDDIFVPSPDIFTHLGCGVPTAGDPGNSKYFALIGDNNKGKVFKAYWDFVNDDKWTWKRIDNLTDGIDVVLDNCGRAPATSAMARTWSPTASWTSSTGSRPRTRRLPSAVRPAETPEPTGACARWPTTTSATTATSRRGPSPRGPRSRARTFRHCRGASRRTTSPTSIRMCMSRPSGSTPPTRSTPRCTER